MDAVFTVVVEVFAGVHRLEEDFFRPFAHGDDRQWLQGQRQGLLQGFGLEIEDKDPVETHLHGFQEDALGGDAQVDPHGAVGLHGAANHQEGFRLHPFLGQVLIRQGGAQFDEGQHFPGFFGRDQPEAERLPVHAGGHQGAGFHQGAELFPAHFPGGIIAPVAAVAPQQGVQRGIRPLDDRLVAALPLLHLVFQKVVCHGG